MPELVRYGSFGVEFICGFHNNEGRVCDQIMGFQQPVYGYFRDEVALGIGKIHRKLARTKLGLIKRQVDDFDLNVVADSVPDQVRPGRTVSQRLRPTRQIQVVPTIKCWPRNADLCQSASHRQAGLLDDPNDLKLLFGNVYHSWLPPTPIMLFLSNRSSTVCSATTSFSALASRLKSFTSLEVAARAVSPDRRRSPASKNSFDQL